MRSDRGAPGRTPAAGPAASGRIAVARSPGSISNADRILVKAVAPAIALKPAFWATFRRTTADRAGLPTRTLAVWGGVVNGVEEWTQNYFPTFDYVRSSAVSVTDLAFCRLSSLADECRDWASCGLVADWPRTKIAGVPAYRDSPDTAAAPHPDQRAGCGGAPEGRSAPLRDGPPAHPSPPHRSRIEAGYGERIEVWRQHTPKRPTPEQLGQLGNAP